MSYSKKKYFMIFTKIGFIAGLLNWTGRDDIVQYLSINRPITISFHDFDIQVMSFTSLCLQLVLHSVSIIDLSSSIVLCAAAAQ